MGEGGKEIKGLSFVENFLLSGAAAVIAKTAAAPIERVKLLVQNQDEMIKQGRLDKPYSGVIDCTVRTFRSEGLLPFWRGNFPNCLRYFPTQALNFAFKDKVKSAFQQNKDDPYMVAFYKNVVSGGTREFNGLVDVYVKTFKSDGIVGLYRGFVISCFGIVVYRGFYFGLYDTLKPIFLGADAGVTVSFLLGYGVTVTAGLISYPIDTIRRRMMMTSGKVFILYYCSIQCAAQILKNEGPMSFMKGAGANILRGVAGAGVLAGFDKFKELYADFRLPKKPTP
ncbi:unnamed protein product [Trichobilharzia regenti]|nr:unnamed protein product [Trichobilharzia regenti]